MMLNILLFLNRRKMQGGSSSCSKKPCFFKSLFHMLLNHDHDGLISFPSHLSPFPQPVPLLHPGEGPPSHHLEHTGGHSFRMVHRHHPTPTDIPDVFFRRFLRGR
uniref:Uncharacterized protein n=1 Tax=Eutreptiella gymnastica TaxID=73025 RepID=A0A7S1NHF2_9EUGL